LIDENCHAAIFHSSFVIRHSVIRHCHAIFVAMRPRHILIVAIDGLRASALGAYGNTMFGTPALDAFAADSFLLDSCYAPSTDLEATYRALWQSVHPARPQTAGRNAPSLPRLLSKHGYTTTFVSDAPEVPSFPLTAEFDQRVEVATAMAATPSAARAADTTGTSMARLFAAAADVMASTAAGSPSAVWVHARGFYGPWDAPLELQHALLDEGDPPPIESVDPPKVFLDATADPDAIFRYGCAYAAQAIVLDACWMGLLATIQSAAPEGGWLIMLLGLRGFPLGEHGTIGGVDPRLYVEQLHVPWLVRFSDGSGRLGRSNQLTTPLELLPTVLACADAEGEKGPLATLDGMSVATLVRNANPAWRESLISVSAAGHRAIRTNDWCLRRDASANAPAELYVRPDDRWEMNDVAKLCPEVTERLARDLDTFVQQSVRC
jgi:hypothetical protein